MENENELDVCQLRSGRVVQHRQREYSTGPRLQESDLATVNNSESQDTLDAPDESSNGTLLENIDTSDDEMEIHQVESNNSPKPTHSADSGTNNNLETLIARMLDNTSDLVRSIQEIKQDIQEVKQDGQNMRLELKQDGQNMHLELKQDNQNIQTII